MSNNHYYISRKGLISLSKQREQLRESLYQSTKEMGESVKRDNDIVKTPNSCSFKTRLVMSYRIKLRNYLEF